MEELGEKCHEAETWWGPFSASPLPSLADLVNLFGESTKEPEQW